MTYNINKKTRKIAVINYKGGTGKTTTLINLAHGLSMSGKKVLIIDTDPQGSAGYHLGINTSSYSLFDLLIRNEDINNCIINARENLDIIPANEHLFPAEIRLSQMKDRELQLSKKLSGIESNYDFILVDCAPSINILNQNALLFSDEAFLPVPMQFLALVGIKQLINNVKTINKVFNSNVKVSKIIPTLINNESKNNDAIYQSIERVFKPIISAYSIGTCESITGSSGKQQSIFEYAPESNGAIDYNNLVQEVLND